MTATVPLVGGTARGGSGLSLPAHGRARRGATRTSAATKERRKCKADAKVHGEKETPSSARFSHRFPQFLKLRKPHVQNGEGTALPRESPKARAARSSGGLRNALQGRA